jgi:hypothetical protein
MHLKVVGIEETISDMHLKVVGIKEASSDMHLSVAKLKVTYLRSNLHQLLTQTHQNPGLQYLEVKKLDVAYLEYRYLWGKSI